MAEKDNLEKGSGEREDQGRAGNLESGLRDSAEPEAYHQVISFWQNREGWTDNLMALIAPSSAESLRLRNVHPGPGVTKHSNGTEWNGMRRNDLE